MDWIQRDLLIVSFYGLQHSLLTTKTAHAIYERLFPAYTWNLVYSIFSVFTLCVGSYFWESSGQYIFYLQPGSILFHLAMFSLAGSLFLFFFCFKYTTSFWQWIGIQQIVYKIKGIEDPVYYRIRANGPKRYIRFPHHTCLVFFFWLHPAMTYDTLFLSVSATIYLYIGTYHQDKRGLRIIGESWNQYRSSTSLLFPSLKTWKLFINDITGAEEARLGKSHSE